VCTLAIPAATLQGWLAPGSGAWADRALLGVDLTALTGALALAWMARATARRVRYGPQDSVWSVRAGPRESDGNQASALVRQVPTAVSRKDGYGNS
ncbi:MAG TPA: hypothetical protein PK177_15890, partial [Burkholderiaceae bacterium]|nr:hypothetical protein [Burkholderiaceae bacterium]